MVGLVNKLPDGILQDLIMPAKKKKKKPPPEEVSPPSGVKRLRLVGLRMDLAYDMIIESWYVFFFLLDDCPAIYKSALEDFRSQC